MNNVCNSFLSNIVKMTNHFLSLEWISVEWFFEHPEPERPCDTNTNFPFPLTFGKPETQTLGGLVIESFAPKCIFAELQPFFQFFIMVDSNFPFSLRLGKLETQTLGGVSKWEFCCRTHFWGARVIFPIFHNG